MGKKFEDYNASHITPQLTLLKKINEIIKFLKVNNDNSVLASSEDFVNISTEYLVSNLNTENPNINDIVIFNNSYIGAIKSIQENKFVLSFAQNIKGEKGDDGVEISTFGTSKSLFDIMNHFGDEFIRGKTYYHIFFSNNNLCSINLYIQQNDKLTITFVAISVNTHIGIVMTNQELELTISEIFSNSKVFSLLPEFPSDTSKEYTLKLHFESGRWNTTWEENV